MAFYQEIRYCIVPDTSLLGDGVCQNFGTYNTAACRFDNGDCIEFNKKWPDCKAPYPFLIEDGKCEGPEYNTPECGYDGGDCLDFNLQYPNCKVNHPHLLNNTRCDKGLSELYDTAECGFDGTDCLDFWDIHENCVVDQRSWIGDGVCDSPLGEKSNTAECDFDGGDCLTFNSKYPDCSVIRPTAIGDGICHGKSYNTKECGYDGGDCATFNSKYPDCKDDGACMDFKNAYPGCKAKIPTLLGDGYCNGGINNLACEFDGGDCDAFNKKYPNCTVKFPEKVGDGICGGEKYNNLDCGYDGGDCTKFNLLFPECNIKDPSRLGDGICDNSEYNNVECGFDGGDCDYYNSQYKGCNVDDPQLLADGICDGFLDENYNTFECGYDGGDCEDFNIKFPDCMDGGCLDFKKEYEGCDVDNPAEIGNGICSSNFNSLECGYDGGDCNATNNLSEVYPECAVDTASQIGDGICDRSNNSPACGHDGGDCDEFNRNFQYCEVDKPSLVGNGICNSYEYNTPECGYDGGDCKGGDECIVDDPSKIGDRKCDGYPYNTAGCGFDGGDCIQFNVLFPECKAPYPHLVGNGFCNGVGYNNIECGHDGKDCIEFNLAYPDCAVAYPVKVGDGVCDGKHNSLECKYDGGDCEQFNKEYPGCKADELLIGNGECNGAYNSPECKYDGGDCTEFRLEYPGCAAVNIASIGDGHCDGGTYNTPECQFDGGDCTDFNIKYPNCFGNNIMELGDGVCQHNTAGCNFDDNDCTLFERLYPNCTAEKPFLVGDGICNEEYNSAECASDGGDCVIDASGVMFVNGQRISVEMYKVYTKTYAIVQILSSIVSLFASSGIILILYRSFKKMSVPFHRLLLGLCIADIISSFAQAFSTVPAPDPFGIIWNAKGTKTSCQVQGFLIFFGSIAAPLYTCSLCIFYLKVITYKNGMNAEAWIRDNIEVYLHAVPIVVSTIGATTILSMDAFNPNMTYCFIGADPTCDNNESCDKANLQARVLFIIFSAVPYLVLPSVIVLTMARMYSAVIAQEKKENQYGVKALRRKLRAGNNASPSLTPVSSHENNDNGAFTRFKSYLLSCGNLSGQNKISVSLGSRSRMILNRALAYTLAFFLTFLFPIIISTRTLIGYESGPALSILARMLFPLQGFFNFLVFIHPKVLHAKRKSRENITWFGAFKKAIQSRGAPIQNARIKLRSGNSKISSLKIQLFRWKSSFGKRKKQLLTQKNTASYPLNLISSDETGENQYLSPSSMATPRGPS